MNDLEIITTSDGSHTLRNKQLNETYHSVHGAVQESMHVFIKHGLEYVCRQHQRENVSVLEVGFGTGLNALLTLRYAAENRINIRYTTIEPFPLNPDVWSELNYGDREQDKEYFKAIHQAEWDREVSLASAFSVLKLKSTLQQVEFPDSYDVIYFDAFAPSVQPEMWVYSSLAKIALALRKDGVFVTYSAKGQLKRDLRSLGLAVETLAGPPGKNEMVRGLRSLQRR